MLPLPRRRVDPELVRERLRAIAAGGAQPTVAHGIAGQEPDRRRLALQGPGVVGPATSGLAPLGLGSEVQEDGDEVPPAAVRTSLRPVVVAVAATALAAWGVVHLTSGGTPSALELVPGTPVPSVSGVLAGPSGTPSPGGASGGTSPSDGADPAADGVVVVQVVGQVRHPGLVTVPRGARVADAVAAAGGLLRGGSSGGLNLARVLVDGEQVVVSPDAVAAPAPVGSDGGAAPAVVDLNSATAADLDTLPGVGPVMAGRILDWRTAHGRFTSVDQLREVSGIGARTVERLKPHVRV